VAADRERHQCRDITTDLVAPNESEVQHMLRSAQSPATGAQEAYKILIIASLRYPIAEPFAGGLEAHTSALARGLRDRGHSVLVAGADGSDPGIVGYEFGGHGFDPGINVGAGGRYYF